MSGTKVSPGFIVQITALFVSNYCYRHAQKAGHAAYDCRVVGKSAVTVKLHEFRSQVANKVEASKPAVFPCLLQDPIGDKGALIWILCALGLCIFSSQLLHLPTVEPQKTAQCIS